MTSPEELSAMSPEPRIDDELPALASAGDDPEKLGKLEKDAATILRERRQKRSDEALNE